ncbi:helix-turn-helix domain-containing protein [Metabacillus idriensis]|uniref:helix-turn-helix domain-containing protein n=1 Tax=Metabacillus idriensis TaxID=324768 RepID=UPI00174C4EF2|nr:helix-turn-helix transcriptional regulator [Metabacillus idriensis]
MNLSERLSKLEKKLDERIKENDFGYYLKKLRGKQSLRSISEKIGVSHTYLGTLENGYDPRTKEVRKPSFEVLRSLADYHNVPFLEMLIRAKYVSKEDIKIYLGKLI